MEPDSAHIDLLAIAGHTAGGKTALAARLARLLGGEIISADSRQVYRNMNLGTGKDYDDYLVDGILVPVHLIDIREAGERYTLFDFKEDFKTAYTDIRSRGHLPILCGGTGLYLESVLRDYPLQEVKPDLDFRAECAFKSEKELINMLKSFGPLHNITDTCERDRLIRAIEIARNRDVSADNSRSAPKLNFRVFGIRYQRGERRDRITQRLKQRLEEGMIDEVKALLQKVDPENLLYYGLEYKYLTLYSLGKLTYNEMFSQLNTAIHQFAKRQMTWFRGMESRGIPITWIPGELPLEEKIRLVRRDA